MKDATRHTILTVAYHEFASRKVYHITMENVAKAFGLGRRTIYPYFKTREELLHAYIKKGIGIVSKQLSLLVNLKASPEQKFSRFILIHMRTIQNLIPHNKLIRMECLKRSDQIEDYRKEINRPERDCLTEIFRRGAQNGNFKLPDYKNTANIPITTLKGFERQFILNNFGRSCYDLFRQWQNILFGGIKASN